LLLKARWSAAGEHLTQGDDGVIAVRPEVIGLWPVGRAPGDLDLRVQGQVRNRIYLGDHTEFSVHVPELGELMVRLPKSDPLAMRLQPGDAAEIGWRADQALALRAA
jgi:ABC-type Fe3+/spermidine/putrescine transport system ATPase subunit